MSYLHCLIERNFDSETFLEIEKIDERVKFILNSYRKKFKELEDLSDLVYELFMNNESLCNADIDKKEAIERIKVVLSNDYS